MDNKEKVQKDVEELMVEYITEFKKQSKTKVDMDVFLKLLDNSSIICCNNLKKQSKSWWNNFSMSEPEIENLVASASANVMLMYLDNFI